MKKFHLPLILLAAMLIVGCRSTTKTRIFLLTSDESLQRLNSSNVKIELRPITLPNYLNRREFIKRIGDDEIKILRSWLWAETSEHSINAAVEQNLKTLLGEDNVLPYGAASNGTPVVFISVRNLEVK
ncbi:MAG: membrane integrity-associated transporter subunit PqiC, partial [Victivallales bacterium]|nr:membrane integrity-associated transporter subunit PqiC [Victivallales bacterium]